MDEGRGSIHVVSNVWTLFLDLQSREKFRRNDNYVLRFCILHWFVATDIANVCRKVLLYDPRTYSRLKFMKVYRKKIGHWSQALFGSKVHAPC